jgi:hypothetical protein
VIVVRLVNVAAAQRWQGCRGRCGTLRQIWTGLGHGRRDTSSATPSSPFSTFELSVRPLLYTLTRIDRLLLAFEDPLRSCVCRLYLRSTSLLSTLYSIQHSSTANDTSASTTTPITGTAPPCRFSALMHRSREIAVTLQTRQALLSMTPLLDWAVEGQATTMCTWRAMP